MSFSRAPSLRRATPTALLLALVALLAAACSAGGTMTVTTAGAQNESAAAPQASAAADDVASGVDAAGVAAPAPRAFEATPSFLAYAADRVETADSLRFEFFQEIQGLPLMEFGDRTTPIMVGEIAGNRSSIEMDLGGLFASMPFAVPGGGDFSMRMITDESTIYLHAPMFSAIADLDPSIRQMPGLGWMTTVAEGWGKIDAGSFLGSDMMGQFGMGSSVDATQFLSMLESVGEVLDGGRSEARGVPTNVVYASVDFADLVGSVDPSIPLPGLDGIDVPISVEVHVDDANLVRRIAYQMDFSSLIPSEQSGAMNMVMWQQIDFFDFNAPIEIVPPIDAVDITSEFGLLAGLGG